jgi:hypothetical protein
MNEADVESGPVIVQAPCALQDHERREEHIEVPAGRPPTQSSLFLKFWRRLRHVSAANRPPGRYTSSAFNDANVPMSVANVIDAARLVMVNRFLTKTAILTLTFEFIIYGGWA